jgi:hypothetical protein
MKEIKNRILRNYITPSNRQNVLAGIIGERA